MEMSYTKYRKALRFGKRLVSGLGVVFATIGVVIYYAPLIEVNPRVYEAMVIIAILVPLIALVIVPDVLGNFVNNIKRSIEAYRTAREMKKIIDHAKRDHVWGWH